jgi:hypothetical protein
MADSRTPVVKCLHSILEAWIYFPVPQKEKKSTIITMKNPLLDFNSKSEHAEVISRLQERSIEIKRFEGQKIEER